MPVEPLPSLVAIEASNSLDFIEKCFTQLNAGKAIVVLKDSNQLKQLSAFSIQENLHCKDDKGWYEGPDFILNHSDSLAQINFTSGTEGLPKGILISHSALANTTQRLLDVMHINSSIREYIGVPVFHSFGFGRCRVVSTIGGRFFIPSNGFDPLEIAALLSEGDINAVSAVPSLWRIVLDVAEVFESCGDKLKWIEIGSQYMSAKEKELLKAIFPNACIVQHYGLTEASRSTFLRIDQCSKSELDSVGQALFGVNIRIGDRGQIQIEGPHIAHSKLIDQKILPILESDQWLDTNDAGYIDNGFLYFEGRLDDQINCGGVKISPDVLELELRSHLGLSSGICVFKLPDPNRGEIPALAILKSLQLDETSVKAIFQKLLNTAGLIIGNNPPVFFVETLPQTSTGKIQRKQLTQSTLESMPQKLNPSSASIIDHTQDPKARQLLEIWQRVLNIESVNVHDSFFDLGGDSLSAIRVSLSMEKAGISKEVCRLIFQGHSIAQIVKLSSTDVSQSNANQTNTKTALAAGSQTINITRGILVLLNVMAHWMPGVLARLPDVFAKINTYFSPLYSSGTPGFSIVFGAGIGYFIYPRYLKDSRSVRLLALRNALLLGSGILLLSLIRLLADYFSGINITALAISNSFWSVLTYYFIAVISFPIWLFLLHRGPFGFFFNSILLGMISYSISLLIETLHIPPSNNALIQPFVLLATAKYNYFEISSGVLVGAAFGSLFRSEVLEAKFLLKNYLAMSIAFILLAIFISLKVNEMHLWLVWPKGIYLWSWLFYIGFALFLLAFVHQYFSMAKHAPILEITGNTIAVIGVLAFPLFIAHEVVIPLKDLLTALQVPGALLISMALYFAVSISLILKIYKLYYSSN